MSRTKGQITIPWNFSGWFTTWKVPEGCTLPSGEGNSCSFLLLPDLHMDQLCRVCCLTGHLSPESYEFTAVAGHGDYRDTLPTRTEDVADQLASIVQVRMLCGLVAQCVGASQRVAGFCSHLCQCSSFCCVLRLAALALLWEASALAPGPLGMKCMRSLAHL